VEERRILNDRVGAFQWVGVLNPVETHGGCRAT
jgi:hypothetical protein